MVPESGVGSRRSTGLWSQEGVSYRLSAGETENEKLLPVPAPGAVSTIILWGPGEHLHTKHILTRQRECGLAPELAGGWEFTHSAAGGSL